MTHEHTLMARYPGFRQELVQTALTQESLCAMTEQVIAIYDEWAALLPDSMGWKRQKPQHARQCREEARRFAPILGFTPLETEFFALLFASHDLGRMVEGLRKCIHPNAPSALRVQVPETFFERWPVLKLPEREHGLDSAALLKPVLGAYATTPLGVWTLTAIELHSNVNNPTRETVHNEEELMLANVMRDLDKVEGFRAAQDYTENPARKARERLQNWPIQIGSDPDWGTELGTIDPPEALTRFVNEQAIVRATCRSYEAYMLQYLAWVFNIVQPEMRAVALHEDGPQRVAQYLLVQLATGNPEQHAQLHKKLLEWNHGVLLR